VKLSTILPAERVLAMLAGVEAKSEHAVAQGILQYTERQGVTPADCREFRAIPGKGVEAVVDGQHFWIGGRRMLEDHGVTEAGMEAEMERYQDRQHTVVAFGAEREVWGLVVLEDPVCEEAQSALQAARRLGVRTLVLLTGDNQGTSEQVARFLALDAYHPNMLPEQKLEAVKILMETHGTVGMVGDGISDAAAMAGSSIGIALGHRGSDLAMEAADVVALSGRLDQLPFLIRHARRTLRLVRQNVAFALGMKAVFLTMTALDMATLWMAIAADTGATLLVTLNGLRMLRPERD
jgi:Cd2+/Zn2+-exporting ATPase